MANRKSGEGENALVPDDEALRLVGEYFSGLPNSERSSPDLPWVDSGKTPAEFADDMNRFRATHEMRIRELYVDAIKRCFEWCDRQLQKKGGEIGKLKGALAYQLRAQVYIEYGERAAIMLEAVDIFVALRRAGVDLRFLLGGLGAKRGAVASALKAIAGALRAGKSFEVVVVDASKSSDAKGARTIVEKDGPGVALSNDGHGSGQASHGVSLRDRHMPSSVRADQDAGHAQIWRAAQRLPRKARSSAPGKPGDRKGDDERSR